MKKLFLALAASAWLLSGCGVYTVNKNNSGLMNLQVGMDRSEVLAAMGQPQRREAYGNTEFLIYRTGFESNSENGNFTPVAIIDGKVAGWGRNYYDNALHSKIDANINIKNQ